MNLPKQQGASSVALARPVFIQSAASIAGKKEGEGPLGNCFDMICEDPLFGTDTWEAAESTMQKEAALLAIGKAGLKPEEIRMVFAGDLLAQSIASSFGIAEMGIPFYGLYGACSTMGESLSLGAMAVAAGYGDHILCAGVVESREYNGKTYTDMLVDFLMASDAMPAAPSPAENRAALAQRMDSAGFAEISEEDGELPF